MNDKAPDQTPSDRPKYRPHPDHEKPLPTQSTPQQSKPEFGELQQNESQQGQDSPQHQTPPTYAPPSYAAPGHTAPSHTEPNFAAPSYAAPNYTSHTNDGTQYPAPPSYSTLGPGENPAFQGATDESILNRPLYGATPVQAIRRFFKNYFNFTGRASRSEYWWVTLAFTVVSLALTFIWVGLLIIIVSITSDQNTAPALLLIPFGFVTLLFVLAYLAILIPSISITWRRLQDAGLSGFFYFLVFVPYVGSLAVLVMTIMPSSLKGLQYDR